MGWKDCLNSWINWKSGLLYSSILVISIIDLIYADKSKSFIFSNLIQSLILHFVIVFIFGGILGGFLWKYKWFKIISLTGVILLSLLIIWGYIDHLNYLEYIVVIMFYLISLIIALRLFLNKSKPYWIRYSSLGFIIPFLPCFIFLVYLSFYSYGGPEAIGLFIFGIPSLVLGIIIGLIVGIVKDRRMSNQIAS